MSCQDSKYIQQAKKLLTQTAEKKLSDEERAIKAVELASYMLKEANKICTFQEKSHQRQLAKMMQDPKGKAFTTKLTDECFRSKSSLRVIIQLRHLIKNLGIPHYLHPFKRLCLFILFHLNPFIAKVLTPLIILLLRKETSTVILPGEPKALLKHMAKRKQEGVRLNLNHLGEAILGEAEALRRLQVYLDDLEKPQVDYISIKISTIFSQIHLLSWDNSLDVLSERLRKLYRAAMKNPSKFVNLDMEEYRDLHLTKELFKKVLSEPEFLSFSAGIVLQAYLPDCFDIQQELTKWAQERIQKGGAPIKIRIVKGANLAMEQVEASLKGWPQAPYTNKALVDANYKKMITFACLPEHAKAVHLGIASHNLFDIAYAMLLRVENKIEKETTFEMLEGMADALRRVVQKLTQNVLLYCPVAEKKDFQNAIAYLIRRLDENTGPENFLRHIFGLKPGSKEWEKQTTHFITACQNAKNQSSLCRKTQNRQDKALLYPTDSPFRNEPDTDFSLEANRIWAQNIHNTWKNKTISPIPCVIGGKNRSCNLLGKGFDPSCPEKEFYQYSLASWEDIDEALETAKKEEASWQKVSVEERAKLLAKVAQKMRENRADLIGVMIADGAKTILEADPEVSEAIDFAEYYLRSLLEIQKHQDIAWQPKGTVLITPPWNFPVSIPSGGILAALAAGNCVIFKPAPEAVLSGWILVNTLWEAGICKNVLQFINCMDDPEGSKLIADPRIDAIILTGATQTAKFFMKLKPDLHLSAETGGKNTFIVTALCDRDMAIKDLVQSAFGHSGQKCSAASLAILEKEVYEDSHFLSQLKDATLSLTVGSAWDLKSKVTPLIKPPQGDLLRALTSLGPGESWLVEPKQDPINPHLWSPGIKLGVQPKSFTHTTEFFGPILGIMKAEDLTQALDLANQTPYGLTAGLCSLDEEEHKVWMHNIQAGNLYINRGITGAIVRRQPFGGCKASCFGPGLKAGGPNYLIPLMNPQQIALPTHQYPLSPEVNNLSHFLHETKFSDKELGLWFASITSYCYHASHFAKSYNPCDPNSLSDLVLGQDNSLYYVSRPGLVLRISEKDNPLDLFRVIAACLSCKTPLEISWTSSPIAFNSLWQKSFPSLLFTQESENIFIKRVENHTFERIRMLATPSLALQKAAAEACCFLDIGPVLANGRFELLHYLKEIALSYDYHRYGNLGLREKEKRNPIE